MEGHGERPRIRGVLARARATLERAGADGTDRLRRATTRAAGALSQATLRLKETPAGEKLNATLETRRVLKRAAKARARGNLLMAYRLLETEIRERPGEPKLALAFWEAAVESERPRDAAEALLGVIRRCAASDTAEAARLWAELVGVLPDVHADAGALVRMVPALLERDAELAVRALQHALEPAAAGLTPGLAVRVAEYARVLDPPTALRAARIALEAPDVHERRRRALRELVRELEREAQAPPAVPSAAPDAERESVAELVVAPALEALVPATRFSGVKGMDSVPTGFGESALELVLGDGRRGRLEYAKIEAIAVAEVAALSPEGVVIDLVLNWSEEGGVPLRLARLHSSRFAAAAVVGGGVADGAALRAFTTRLLERSHAVPLPDLDAVLGDSLRIFESVAEYEREVLLAERL